MKKMIAVAVVALMLCSAVFAQVTVGVRGGFGSSMGTKLVGETAEMLDYAKDYVKNAQDSGVDASFKETSITGASFGVYAKVPVAPSIFVQPEVNYNMANGTGFEAVFKAGGYESKMAMEFSFATLDIPVLIGYELACGPVTVTPFAGPQVSMMASKMKQKGVNGDPDDVTEIEVDGKAKMTFGAVLGCGVTYPVADAIVVGADVRYAMDFNALKTKPEGYDDYEETLKRSALSFSVSAGYKF